ncbi:MAG: acetylglutamate kinase [Acidobacteria bacterium]|nr:acetylglutamate kinase [Acidobacteriota bacterium]
MKAVVKIGGTLLEEPSDRLRLAGQIAQLLRGGHRIFLVHGGGKQLTAYLERLGIASHFVEGLRVTPAETLDGVVQVLAGTVNHQLLAAFHATGVAAVGISGIDAGCLVAEKLRAHQGQDWGYVGQIRKVNPRLWEVLLGAGLLPVLACLAVGDDGQIYNLNADQAAVACAVHLRADCLVFLTDVDGVRGPTGQTIPHLAGEDIPALLQSGAVAGGMLAKLRAVGEALAGNVPRVFVSNGHHNDTLERIFAGHEDGIGTVLLSSGLAGRLREGFCHSPHLLGS